MIYRFVRVTSNYPEFINNFFFKNTDVHLKSYQDQHNQLTNASFEIASSYTKNLNAIGVDAFDIISNANTLQNAWKRENNLSEDISSKELIIHQLKFYQPDVVWIDDFSHIDAKWKADLLKQVPSIKLIIGHICAPYSSLFAEKFKLVDVMFTCIPCFVSELQKLGIKTHLLYHGFDSSILKDINTNNPFPKTEFLFSGSLYTGSGFHKKRIEYIEAMLESDIPMNLYCNLESFKKITAKKAAYKTIRALKYLKQTNLIDSIPILRKHSKLGDTPVKYYSKKLIKNSHPPVFGYEMYQLLAKSNICFNIHGEVAEKCAGNIRLFEATGVGACLVTDWKDNIKDLFEPDKEIVTYKSVDECIEKVKWLMNNPIEMEKIAKAGQKRTLSTHTISLRVNQVNEIILKELNKFAQ